MLNDVGEALVVLASFTGRLEQILESGGLHILGATANLGGKKLVESFKLVQRPEEHSQVGTPIVKALGDANVDRPSGGHRNGYCTNSRDQHLLHGYKGSGVCWDHGEFYS